MSETYLVDALRDQGYHIFLDQGLGNRINIIMFLAKYKLPFYWARDKNISESYKGVFDFDNVDISITDQKPPYVINMDKFPGTWPTVKIPSDEMNWRNKWFTTPVDFDVVMKVEPGESVKPLLIDLPENTIGYSVRRHYSCKETKPVYDIPDNSFLTTDCPEQREQSQNTIQLHSGASFEQFCDDKQEPITVTSSLARAAADWFQLRRCREIVCLGHRSTYAEALAICKYFRNASIK